MPSTLTHWKTPFDPPIAVATAQTSGAKIFHLRDGRAPRAAARHRVLIGHIPGRADHRSPARAWKARTPATAWAERLLNSCCRVSAACVPGVSSIGAKIRSGNCLQIMAEMDGCAQCPSIPNRVCESSHGWQTRCIVESPSAPHRFRWRRWAAKPTDWAQRVLGLNINEFMQTECIWCGQSAPSPGRQPWRCIASRPGNPRSPVLMSMAMSCSDGSGARLRFKRPDRDVSGYWLQ